MTLITYPTRIHFADGVLEEALRSELDAHGLVRPMILGEAEEADSDLSQRIYAGLPRKARPLHVTIGPHDTKYTTSHRAEVETRGRRPDVIVAYGSARAIAYARKCRHGLHQTDCDHGIPARPSISLPCRVSMACPTRVACFMNPDRPCWTPPAAAGCRGS